METSQFDRFSKILAASGSRRAVSILLAALPLSGISRLDQEADAARPRRRRRQRARSRDRVAQEKKGKGTLLCFNGETISAKKKKKKKLLKQGATQGECPPSPPSPPPPSPPSPPPPLPPPPPPPCDWSFSTQIGPEVEGSDPDDIKVPFGVAVAPDGLTAWVADTGNHRVLVWTRPNASSTTWSFNAEIGGFDDFGAPEGVAASPDGLTVWVVDRLDLLVTVWTRPNTSSTTWSLNAQFGGDEDFNFPEGVTVSPDGLTVWVADTGNNRVVVWTRPDASSTTWSFNAQLGTGVAGSGTNQFDRPEDVAISPDGLTAWVADRLNHRIAVWTRPNASSTTWSFNNAQIGVGTNEFYLPSAVAVSSDSLTVWVADILNDRVLVWTRPTASSTTWILEDDLRTGNNLRVRPEGLAVSLDGQTVWVADVANNRVALWTRGSCPS